MLRLTVKHSHEPIQEGDLLALLCAAAKEADAWLPPLRKVAVEVELHWRLPADAIERVRARCAQLCATPGDK